MFAETEFSRAFGITPTEDRMRYELGQNLAGLYAAIIASGMAAGGNAESVGGEKPKFPGNNPKTQPNPDYEWRGDPDKGSWYNPKTKEVLRGDLDHADPVGSHWDYRAPDGTWYRLYPDGRLEPK